MHFVLSTLYYETTKHFNFAQSQIFTPTKVIINLTLATSFIENYSCKNKV